MGDSRTRAGRPIAELRAILGSGIVIPACPLALTEHRTFDEQLQRALLRYYAAASAGGVAIGVHTTQFAIRDPKHNLFERLLTAAADELIRLAPGMFRIAGICGHTEQALAEASTRAGPRLRCWPSYAGGDARGIRRRTH